MSVIYLAGPITGLTYDNADSWRSDITPRLEALGHEVRNPLHGDEYLRELGELPSQYDGDVLSFHRDLHHINRADVIMANFTGSGWASIGSCCELGYAYARDKQIIAVVEPENVHNHLFIREMATWLVNDLEDAIATLAQVPV